MNIFVLDYNIEKCAQFHCNSHVIKQILESTQLLNNARIMHNPNASPIYKQTHKNHPCTVWCSKTISNFNWLVDLGLALCSEYTFRYNKRHKCQDIIEFFSKHDFFIPSGELTPFVQCMPDIYRGDNAVDAYRKYYINEKKNIAIWSKRSKPEWYI
jgi:hypothetical protein